MSLFCFIQKAVFCKVCVERSSQILLAVRRKIRLRKSLNSSKSLLFFSPRKLNSDYCAQITGISVWTASLVFCSWQVQKFVLFFTAAFIWVLGFTYIAHRGQLQKSKTEGTRL